MFVLNWLFMTVAKERERKPDEEGTFYQVSI